MAVILPNFVKVLKSDYTCKNYKFIIGLNKLDKGSIYFTTLHNINDFYNDGDIIVEIIPSEPILKINNSKYKSTEFIITNKYWHLNNLITYQILCIKMESINLAAFNGRLEIVKYLCENKTDFTSFAIDSAASNGHLDIVKYLYGLKKINTSLAIDWAAEGGYLEIIKFLHENGQSGSHLAIDKAAHNGHFEIVKYLHNKKYIGSNLAIDKNGNLEIVKFLYENGYKWTTNALIYCCYYGYYDVLKFLINLYGKSKIKNECDIFIALNKACKYGYIDIVKYLIEDIGIIPTEKCFKYAIKNDNKEIFNLISKYL